MKLPYKQDAAWCYDEIRKVNAGYRDGFDAMQRIASADSPFPERLQSMLREHQQVLVRGKELPPLTPRREEDVYLCCLYDLLEAFFENEAMRLTHAGAGKTAFADLQRQLASIPFESPKWKNGARVHIQETIQKIAERSGDKQ